MRGLSACILLTLVCITGRALADTELDRATLRGIRTFYVAVEVNDALDAIADSTVLLADLQLKLRQNGIGVLTRDEWMRKITPGATLKATYLGTPTRAGYAIRLELGVFQGVRLERNTDIWTVAETWGEGQLRSYTDMARARADMGTLVDSFLNAYRTVNPKRR